ncbi:DUF4893 domain-containing protein [Paracoccaceae bacterium GXU_MW_L88]
MLKPLLALLALALPAQAQNAAQVWTQQDFQRLDEYDYSLGLALRKALAAGSSDAHDILLEAMEGEPIPIDTEALLGEWRCQTIKLGGDLTPITAYSPFTCEITEEDGALWFHKRTGSQLTDGKLYADNGERMVYLGVFHASFNPPAAYEDLPEITDVAASPSHYPQPGFLEMVSENKARIGFPAPFYESDFDYLYLTR